MDHRDAIYAKLGVPPEEPPPRERVAPPTLAEIDQRIEARIAACNELMIETLGEVVAQLRREWVVGAMGPPGPSGPRGDEGPPGKLPIVKLWTPETVYYAGDVVAYDGGTFQAQRDTGQPPSHAHWMCLASSGRDGKTIAVRGTFDQSASYRRLDVVAFACLACRARRDSSRADFCYLTRSPNNIPVRIVDYVLARSATWLARPEGFEPPTPRFVV
jgi:hypothetical protein